MTNPDEASVDELVERLNRAAQQASDIQRQMAEAKSLRQEDNAERRTDLYMWPTPEQTVEGQAAARLTALSKRVRELKAALERVDRNFDLLLRGKPVRDVAETKAEVAAALNKEQTNG